MMISPIPCRRKHRGSVCQSQHVQDDRRQQEPDNEVRAEQKSLSSSVVSGQ